MSLTSALLARAMPDLGSETRGQGAGHLSGARPCCGRTAGCCSRWAWRWSIIAASRSVRTGLLPLWADHVGLSASTTSLIFALAAAIDIAFFLPGGWLMDTRGRFVVAVPVVAATAVACLLLPLADHRDRRGRRDGADRSSATASARAS